VEKETQTLSVLGHNEKVRALDGIRILDLTRLLPGPMATAWLLDLGAEVIKIEEPGVGDYLRSMNPPLFELINRGKSSVLLNLKSTAGREAFLRMSEHADVVIEGFRPGVMDRLGCGYTALRRRNRRLVYLALTGYGYDSPYRDLAGHDVNYLALCGVLDLIGPPDGPPVIPGIQIADLAGGSMHAVNGVLAALLKRARTGEGEFVDISMAHGSALLLPVAAAQAATGRPPQRGAEMLSGRYACYNVYAARDGRYVAVGALEPKFWTTLCRAIGCESFIPDQFAGDPRRLEILEAMRTRFLEKDAEEWFTLLKNTDACLTPVRSVTEAAAEFAWHPVSAEPAPRLGAHTAAWLARIGLSEDEIASATQ
jgi:crotonobetainyl-CoA:carnitine CoA-transferase CaiB-like acyl-CoA transferase